MITLWMLYCLGVSALLTLAAAACEYVLRGRGMPLRGVWACAIAGSLLLPAWSLASSFSFADDAADEISVTERSVAPAAALEQAAPLVATLTVDAPANTPSLARALAPARPILDAVSPGVLVAWLVSSLWMIVFLLGGWLSIRAQRAGWRRVKLGEREVMISDRTGPAVVGFVHPAIVLPEWTLQLETSRRGLVLLHEEEHLRAHDERLLFFASIALIVMPCNVALWYQVRRLRLAVEMDCDARVLRVHPDPREYGDLLLDVGSRASSAAMQMAALSEPVSFLARRISAMMAARRQSRPAAMVTLVGAVAAASIAWQTPRPPVPAFTAAWRTIDSPKVLPSALRDSIPMVIWDGERMTQDSLVRRLYGTKLALAGSGVLEFVVDADGVVRSAGVRSGPTVYRSADTTVILRAFEDGYGSVASADVASIEIDRTRYGFPEISSVIWVRLKPGARVATAGNGRRGSRAVAAAQSRMASDSARIAGRGASARTTRSLAISADSQSLMVARMASQLARHEAETARLQAEMTRHAADAARLRARLAALDTLNERLAPLGGRLGDGYRPRPGMTAVDGNAPPPLSYGSGGRGYAPRAPTISRDAMMAVARRHYPELFANPPQAPVTLWFLADTADQVIETLIQRAPLGTVGHARVINAFPAIAPERIESWTAASPSPFGIVWVRVRR